jgi:hypothetical protein
LVSGFLVGLQLHPGGIKTVIPTWKREAAAVAFFGFKMNKNEKQPDDKSAAHALLDAARDGADIPQAEIDAALVLTGDMDAAQATARSRSMSRRTIPTSPLTIALLVALESMGAATTSALAAKLGQSAGATEARLGASVRKRLASVDQTHRPRRYAVAPGWRELIDVVRKPQDVPVAPPADGNLRIEYAARPRITGPLARTPWAGLCYLAPA